MLGIRSSQRLIRNEKDAMRNAQFLLRVWIADGHVELLFVMFKSYHLLKAGRLSPQPSKKIQRFSLDRLCLMFDIETM